LKKLLILAIAIITLLVPTAVMGAPIDGDSINFSVEPVPPTVVIDVEPSGIDFGQIVIGQSSIQPFTIKNNIDAGSNVNAIVTARLSALNTESMDFYEDYMTISSDNINWPYVSGFSYLLAKGETKTIWVKMAPLTGSGGYDATMVFMSEASLTP
jgi:hypothetical protein